MKTKEDFESATTTRDYINDAFKNTFGEKAIRRDHFLVFSCANNDGLRPKRGIKRKEIISDEIDKFSDGFFGGIQDQNYFLKVDRLEDTKLTIGKKPVITGSDAHSFEDLDNFLEKRSMGKELITKNITWIKADPTFEGLKQILYEPEPGERVCIGPNLPDQKEPYQVIKKIKFENTSDFPEEIIFNQNLCSIIGSRSSGKSALVLYLAHAIDEDLTEELTDGAGEGEEYKWENINSSGINYTVEWGNGLKNEESPGKIILIPQNYLFSRSKDSNEIKNKIEPVLFKRYPDFKGKYEKFLNEIKKYNETITDLIEKWFGLSDKIEELKEQLKNFGNKNAIEKEKIDTKKKIKEYQEKYTLSEEEIETYRKLKNNIEELENIIKQDRENINEIFSILGEGGIFDDLIIEFKTGIDNLPNELIVKIKNELDKNKKHILEEINKIVKEYKKSLDSKIKESREKIENLKEKNCSLIEKYQKNEELEKNIKKDIEYKQQLKEIDNYNKKLEDFKKDRDNNAKIIKEFIRKRKEVLEKIQKALEEIDQSKNDIKFSIEYEMEKNDLDIIGAKINLKEVTSFVENYTFNIERIRENPDEWLLDLYCGKQKINKGYDKKEVAIDILTFTESIMFVGEMEGDKIGGFSETTMTPGKRALFLLKLILAESDDKWPILIDQPEDNLDSRSITDEIVPFLKKKKKERQIIMVSHNANLVIGADSEQIIVANRHGKDRPNSDNKQFNYLTGSIENTKEKDDSIKDTLKCQGIREHACLILDGGEKAFEQRRDKYNILK